MNRKEITDEERNAYLNTRSYPLDMPATQAPLVVSGSRAFSHRAYPSTEDIKKTFLPEPQFKFRIVTSSPLEQSSQQYELVLTTDNFIG